MEGAPEFWVLVALAPALMVATAKAHGRQIRLERELEGFWEVSFGARAKNPAWVEELWRLDRHRFWTLCAAASALGAAAAWFAATSGSWWPRLEGASASQLRVGLPMVAALAWGPTVAFAVNGLLSLRRLRRRLAAPAREPAGSTRGRDQMPAGDPRWAAAARRGTRFWWGLVALLTAATLVVTL